MLPARDLILCYLQPLAKGHKLSKVVRDHAVSQRSDSVTVFSPGCFLSLKAYRPLFIISLILF